MYLFSTEISGCLNIPLVGPRDGTKFAGLSAKYISHLFLQSMFFGQMARPNADCRYDILSRWKNGMLR